MSWKEVTANWITYAIVFAYLVSVFVKMGYGVEIPDSLTNAFNVLMGFYFTVAGGNVVRKLSASMNAQ
jgi:hypothetical protein